MKASLLSFGAGLVVGVVYSLLGVRSPAPPVVALIGLLGILLGEQIVPVGRELIAGTSIGTAWRQARCGQHVFGAMPGSHPQPVDKRQTLASARCSHERTEPSCRSHP